MQRMGPLLCFWTGGIRRAEQARLRWSLAPPRGERARDCAARSASRPPPVRRIPPSPPRRSKLCIACSGFFHFIPKSRSALTPLLLLSAKGSAWLACSLASALTTARRRCQPFAGPVRAHAAHGPSALLLDRWDSKGGTENAAVRHFPAPGSDGPQLCSLEGKQQEASAENPTLSAASEQALYRLLRLFSFHSQKPERAHAAAPPFRKRFRLARLLACKRAHNGSPSLPTFCGARKGPCVAWALCFAFGQVGFEGRNRKCRSAAFSRPGSLAPPRWSPVPGASPRPGKNGRGNRSGQRADAPRERRGERQRLALKHPFHPLQIRSASRVTSFQASPANRRGSRPPRSPR